MVYLIGRLSERPVILEFVCQKGLCLLSVILGTEILIIVSII